MPGEQQVNRTISQFWPLPGQDPEESDRHYREVHTVWARGVLRTMDSMLSYHVARSVSERDLNDTWRQRPSTFRWISLRSTGAGFEPTPAQRAALVEDHRQFLSHHTTYRVQEEVLLDRLSGQTSLVKYVVEFDRDPATDAEVAVQEFTARAQALATSARTAFGLRLVVANTVTAEFRSEPLDHPGQRPTTTPVDDSTRTGFVEVWADQHAWAEEWWRDTAATAALDPAGWGRVRATLVDEECGIDKR